MQEFYQCLIARMNGPEVKKNFSYYSSLVKRGIGGFIIFGGEIEQVRKSVLELQSQARLPLIIASDIERGVGQQLRGGTHFPPAMALGKAYARRVGKARKPAIDIDVLRRSFRAVAEEAKYAGINTILAPVLDINTNPKNPIIATRAFGEDPDRVSALGCEMIRTLQRCGVSACGKHFPGHGDTSVDSHLKLPAINSPLKLLLKRELSPFKAAVECGVRMIMMGHLSVPALDRSGAPVSLSKRAVSFLRREFNFGGLLMTDAMNMGGLAGYSEGEAASLALRAGVDIILHPSDPEAIAGYLEKENIAPDRTRLVEFRKGLGSGAALPHFERNRVFSKKMTGAALDLSGEFVITGRTLLLILSDDELPKGRLFSKRLREKIPSLVTKMITPKDGPIEIGAAKGFVILSIFSEVKGWKGGASPWLYGALQLLKERADLLVSFGSPYLLDGIDLPKLFVYWDSEQAQEAAAVLISKKFKPG